MAKKYKRTKNKEGFISKANLKHNNFYDYSKVVFTPREKGNMTRQPSEYYGQEIITIICPKHGEYNQRARKHLEGNGCHSCAREATSGALIDRNKDACFLNAHDFKEFDNHIEIYSTPSDGIQRTILISKEDKDILSYCKWHVTGHQKSRHSRTNYCVSRQTNRLIKEGYDWLGTGPKIHRLIMSRMNSRKLDRSEQVDHINHDGLDNRRENLQLVTSRQNSVNMPKNRTWGGRPTSSQYKGVCRVNRPGRWGHGKWHCSIKEDGKKNNIGIFDDEVEAAKAYDKEACRIHGEYAVLNFPNEKNTEKKF